MDERDFRGYFSEWADDPPPNGEVPADHHKGEATARELEIALQISHGMNNRQTGDALGVSVNTVKTHMRRLTLKFNAKTRVHLIAILLRRGLIK